MTVVPRSENQKLYMEAVIQNDLIFGVGPAGTGKTFLAVALGIEMLMRQFNEHTKKTSNIKRMIIARPAVEAGENLGFLPGDMTDKVDPYMRPIFDALYDTLGHRMDEFLEEGTIEVAPLAFMRGRTLKDSIIILDEAQNTTRAQMKMFLTRIGNNTKTIVNGDVTQIDLEPAKMSGLIQAIRILPQIDNINLIEFDEKDVVRHPMVKEIIRAYNSSLWDK